MCLMPDTVTVVWLDILPAKTKPIMVGACYQTPARPFFLWNIQINESPDFFKLVKMMGDFNTNIQK